MPLTGTYERNLEEKFRVAVPKRLREQFSDAKLKSLFVAPGATQSLSLYAPAEFESLAARLTAQTQNPTRIQNYLRLFYARSEQVALDAQGRIRIPERLVEFAGLQREVVLLGVHDHAEIWDRAKWNAFLESHAADYDEIARQAFEQS